MSVEPWLITERLLLRRPTHDDLDAVFAIHSDPHTSRHLPSGVMRSPTEAASLLAEWLRHWALLVRLRQRRAS